MDRAASAALQAACACVNVLTCLFFRLVLFVVLSAGSGHRLIQRKARDFPDDYALVYFFGTHDLYVALRERKSDACRLTLASVCVCGDAVAKCG